MAELGAVCLMA